MRVPHLDTRIIDGQRSPLFGPHAGFSGKFLKHGSLPDLFESLRPANIKALLSVARDNFDLTEYLIGQLLQSEIHRLATLDEYFPNADPKDWRLQVAGQRVQIIKPDIKRGGLLEFGTELVGAAGARDLRRTRLRRRDRVGEFSRDLHVLCVPCDGLDCRSSAQILQRLRSSF